MFSAQRKTAASIPFLNLQDWWLSGAGFRRQLNTRVHLQIERSWHRCININVICIDTWRELYIHSTAALIMLIQLLIQFRLTVAVAVRCAGHRYVTAIQDTPTKILCVSVDTCIFTRTVNPTYKYCQLHGITVSMLCKERVTHVSPITIRKNI